MQYVNCVIHFDIASVSVDNLVLQKNFSIAHIGCMGLNYIDWFFNEIMVTKMAAHIFIVFKFFKRWKWVFLTCVIRGQFLLVCFATGYFDLPFTKPFQVLLNTWLEFWKYHWDNEKYGILLIMYVKEEKEFCAHVLSLSWDSCRIHYT